MAWYRRGRRPCGDFPQGGGAAKCRRQRERIKGAWERQLDWDKREQ